METMLETMTLLISKLFDLFFVIQIIMNRIYQ